MGVHIECPRGCGMALQLVPDGRLHCLACSRYYGVTLTEDSVGPLTPSEEHRNLLEFVHAVETGGRKRKEPHGTSNN